MAVHSAAREDEALSEVAAAWRSGQEDRLSDLLGQIRTPSSSLFNGTSELISILRDTPSPRIRAAASMALVDIGARDAIDPLLDVLRRPDLAKASGTLIFALSELGAALPLDLAVRLIEGGSFEARSGVLELMEEGRIAAFSAADASRARETLAQLAGSDDPETAGAADLALEYLERVATGA